MRLLVLGGTKFLGRALVEAALAREDEVTLFNRGVTNPGLFPELEHVRGDRSVSLSALAGREWDAVVDVAAFTTPVVRRSVETLLDAVDRYVFVSSISVYADLGVPPVEGAPVAELEGPEDERPESYGARKAACEEIVAAAFGDRALVVRPGLLVGPHDPTDRFTYWPRRVAAGGEVLAPGAPSDPVQFVDVRDLAAWILEATAGGASGVFNATGRPLPFGELLDECRRATGSDARFTWVPSDSLLAAGVEEWTELPLWIASAEARGINRADVSKALASGLRFRPLEATILDTLAWDAVRDWPRADGVGLSSERERELLAAA